MWRRIYFSFPRAEQARRVVAELEAAFAVRRPYAHLSELSEPLRHGELALLVDVPHGRVREIAQLVSPRHPETGLGGVGWTIASAHL